MDDDWHHRGGKGGITTEKTVWCGRCSKWEQISHYSMSATLREFRGMGWKKHKVFVWLCPKCAQDMRNGNEPS